MTKNVDEMEMRDEYDFSNAIRNPYVQKFGDLNLVSLDPDVREAFPDSRAVNEALRLLIKTAKSAQEFSKTSGAFQCLLHEPYVGSRSSYGGLRIRGLFRDGGCRRGTGC